MKKLLKCIIWSIVVLVVVVVGGTYLLPDEAVVERHVVINAPADKVYAIIASMKRFNEWSPWAAIDPATRYSFAGPDAGVGQKMSWTSKDANVGNGSQSIIAAIDNSRTVNEIDFGAMGKARTTLALAAVNGGTGVTWTFRTDLTGIGDRWMGLMFDRWIGADYEKGLANLKALAEKEAAGG